MAHESNAATVAYVKFISSIDDPERIGKMLKSLSEVFDTLSNLYR